MDNKTQDLFSAIADLGATKDLFFERPGQDPIKVTVRPLTGEESALGEAFFDGIYPPPLIEEFPGDEITPPSKKKIGNDVEDPDYLQKCSKAADEREAFVALRCVIGLSDQESLKSLDLTQQLALIKKRWPKPLIHLIAGAALRFEIRVADKAEDLLTSGSAALTSSDASATKSATESSASQATPPAPNSSKTTTTKASKSAPATGGAATASQTG